MAISKNKSKNVKTVQKSSRTHKRNIKNSRKTRKNMSKQKNMKKMKGGDDDVGEYKCTKYPGIFKYEDIMLTRKTKTVQTDFDDALFLQRIKNKSRGFVYTNHLEYEIIEINICKLLDTNVLDNLISLNLSYTNLIGHVNLINICNLLNQTKKLNELFLSFSFEENYYNLDDFKMFFEALKNNKTLYYLDILYNKTFFDTDKLECLYYMYINLNQKKLDLSNDPEHIDNMLLYSIKIDELYILAPGEYEGNNYKNDDPKYIPFNSPLIRVIFLQMISRILMDNSAEINDVETELFRTMNSVMHSEIDDDDNSKKMKGIPKCIKIIEGILQKQNLIEQPKETYNS
jgi:hypothetical protein